MAKGESSYRGELYAELTSLCAAGNLIELVFGLSGSLAPLM